MPYRRATFRRPEPPPIEQFLDQLESNLRYVMLVDPPTQASRLQHVWDRGSRWMLRPVTHGGMALVMIFILAMSFSTPNRRIVMDVSDRVPSETNNDAYWVDVIEVPDPVPTTYPSVSPRQVSRFVVLVEPATKSPFIPAAIGLTAV